MTPERLEQIRWHFKDSPDEALAAELLGEIERMRESVRTLPRLTVAFRRGLDDDYSIHEHPEGEFMDAEDVMEALGIE